jgi:hypothetical protein
MITICGARNTAQRAVLDVVVKGVVGSPNYSLAPVGRECSYYD